MSVDPIRRRLLAGGLGAAALVLLGCGSDDDDAAAPSTSAPEAPTTGLPTGTEDELKVLVDARIADLEQRATRAMLYAYPEMEPDPDGRLLAVYTEPFEPEQWDTDRYMETMIPGLVALAPWAFATWPDLERFDICQEVVELSGEVKPPRTQVMLTREESDRIDWDAVTLADLLLAAGRSPDTMYVFGQPDVAAHPVWVDAVRQVEEA